MLYGFHYNMIGLSCVNVIRFKKKRLRKRPQHSGERQLIRLQEKLILIVQLISTMLNVQLIDLNADKSFRKPMS